MSILAETNIFISDLHLGDGSKADDFIRKNEFLHFLDSIEKESTRLFIVGDLFELWQADLDRAVFHHSEVIKRLFNLASRNRLVYIIGNHDHIPFVKYLDPKLSIYLEFIDKELGLRVEHGNQYDIFNRYQDPRMALRNVWGRRASYLIGWLERIVHPDIDEWGRRNLIRKGGLFLEKAAYINNKLTPSSKEYFERGGGLLEFEEAARKHINSGMRIVIFGHTHKAVLTKMGSGIYANCGCWCGSDEPTYIRLTDSKIELLNGIDHKLINSLEL
ncbi:MAG: metallophosphoesterase [Candidatus Omnitrophota bacterium]